MLWTRTCIVSKICSDYRVVVTFISLLCSFQSGDGTEEDFEAARLAEKERYEEKKREKAEREAELRKYSHRYKNKKPGVQMVEAVEVVESDEED
jgi:hypothetical protein